MLRWIAFSWVANLVALWVTAWVLGGVTYSRFGQLVIAGAVFGVLNTVLKPLLLLLTLPLALLTLGIAWFFVAMLMLHLTDLIVTGLRIHGFWTLVGATVIVWLVNLALDHLGPGKHKRRRWHFARLDT